jgi:phosphate starvation-inducible protein PhoH and related proteins
MGRHKAKTNIKNRKSLLNEPYFHLQEISAITFTQDKVWTAYESGKNLFLHGLAGTGKTFISCYLGMSEVLETQSVYKNLTIVRSVVPTRDIGFLPGTEEQKTEVYEAPYKSIFTNIFQRGDAYEILRKKNAVNFLTTSYIRGITLEDTIIIVDECQNLNFHELDTIITRIGDNCKIIFCGDFRQSDFNKSTERKGVQDFIEIIKDMPEFSFIEFHQSDIVRSELVKNYIILKDKKGL